jgi:DNA-binding transcriptional ArsR family regulator
MSTRDQEDRVFKALASDTRRRILDLLKDRPMTTGQICDQFADLHRVTVMQHMGVLVEADLLIVARKGRERWNHLNPLPIKDIHDRWIGDYASSAVDLLARLQSDLETPEAPT